MAVDFIQYHTEQHAGDALYNELRHVFGESSLHGPEAGDPGSAERGAPSPYVVMLAGGSTPLEVYRRISQEPPRHVHPALHLMLSDDRYVLPDDERSNYRHVRPLAEALGLPDSRLVHVDGTRELPVAVEGFEAGIRDLAEREAVFSVAVLGIGADGHTASLFSHAQIGELPEGAGSAGAGGSAAGSGRLHPSPATPLAMHTGLYGGVDRVSVTSSVLLAFRTLIFFATGAAKRDVLYELSRRPETLPAGRLMLAHPNAHIWTDEAPRVQ